MMINQFRPQIAVATLVLFILSCSSGPAEVSTDNNNDAVEMVQAETSTAGSITIAELVANADSYAGKTVQISGTCTKVNTAILGHNWIHLKDGSKDDFDMVITSDANVATGSVVTMKGIVALNKDFGYGYTYELLIEEGEVVE